MKICATTLRCDKDCYVCVCVCMQRNRTEGVANAVLSVLVSAPVRTDRTVHLLTIMITISMVKKTLLQLFGCALMWTVA